MTILSEQQRKAAHEFLDDLSDALERTLPAGSGMERQIRAMVSLAKKSETQKHLRLPEAAFLNAFAIPVVIEHLRRALKLTPQQARQAFLNEYHRTMPDTSLASPYRALKHPFRKLMNVSADEVYRLWCSPAEKHGLSSCGPDFALRAPCPHRILFEGKYFAQGSETYAKRELVKNVYQAFFYRGLPASKATTKSGADWDYDFACLLAFDASPGGTLRKAWNEVPAPVKRSLWDGANVYVMILRGTQ